MEVIYLKQWGIIQTFLISGIYGKIIVPSVKDQSLLKTLK